VKKIVKKEGKRQSGREIQQTNISVSTVFFKKPNWRFLYVNTLDQGIQQIWRALLGAVRRL
jgi:hypothetical protein